MRRVAARSLVLLLACAACATHEPPAPVGPFLGGDLQCMRAFSEKQLQEGNANSRALYESYLGSVDLLLGDLEGAFRSFRRAGAFMGNWQVSGAEEFNAIFGSESSKAWRGDPYERAMNGYYLGLLYWMRGEPDNARAAFKRAILADGESEGESYQVDFTLLFWLAGRMSLAMGLPDDAESFFKEARQAQNFAIEHGSRATPNPRVLREPGAGNVVLLVDVGLGPEKYGGGDDGELAAFRGRLRAETCAEIYADGKSLGTTQILGDLYYQAATRGGTAMEGIRKGKAVFKKVGTVAGTVLVLEGTRGKAGRRDTANTELAVGVGLLALALLTSTHADTRHWTILPDTVQVLTADLTPGPHDLRVVFRDGGGTEIPSLSQNWTVDVPESGEAVHYFRSIPGLDQVRNPQVKS